MGSKSYIMYWFSLEEDRKEVIEEVLARYMKKYGKPPSVIEYSNKIDKIKSTNGVPLVQMPIPPNILLLGE